MMIDSLFDGMDYSLSITRARLEMLSYTVIDEYLRPIIIIISMMSKVTQTLSTAPVASEDITEVIIIGGR